MAFTTRKTADLRRGRVSIPGALYFVTICTHHRVTLLIQPSFAANILKTAQALQTSSDYDLWAATVMPDHEHLLFALGHRLSLAQTIAKFKSLSRNLGRVSWNWQDNVFEHRLRPHESPENYGFYIFMNPYRAKLLDTSHS